LLGKKLCEGKMIEEVTEDDIEVYEVIKEIELQVVRKDEVEKVS